MTESAITQIGSRVTVQVGEATVSWSTEKGVYGRPPFTVEAYVAPGHLRDLVGAVQAAQALYIEQDTAKGAQR